MNDFNTPTTGVRPTILDDGLEVEVFTTEDEAQAAWNLVPSHIERQAAVFVAQTAHIASEPESAIDEPMSKWQLIRTTIGLFLLSSLFTGLWLYGAHRDPTTSTYVYFFGVPLTWLLGIALTVFNVQRYRASKTAEDGPADTAWIVVLRRANCIENWEARAMMVRGSGMVYIAVGEQEIGSFPETDADAISAALQQAEVSQVGWNSIEESLAQGNFFPKWSEHAHLNRHSSDGRFE